MAQQMPDRAVGIALVVMGCVVIVLVQRALGHNLVVVSMRMPAK
jgi:hypothetical protein